MEKRQGQVLSRKTNINNRGRQHIWRPLLFVLSLLKEKTAISFDHDFDHSQSKVRNALLSQKCRLGRSKMGNELYWDAKTPVKTLSESWGSRDREFPRQHQAGETYSRNVRADVV